MGVYESPGKNPPRPDSPYQRPPAPWGEPVDAVTRPRPRPSERDPYQHFSDPTPRNELPAWYIDAHNYTDLAVETKERWQIRKDLNERPTEYKQMMHSLEHGRKTYVPPQPIDIGRYIDDFFTKPVYGN